MGSGPLVGSMATPAGREDKCRGRSSSSVTSVLSAKIGMPATTRPPLAQGPLFKAESAYICGQKRAHVLNLTSSREGSVVALQTEMENNHIGSSTHKNS